MGWADLSEDLLILVISYLTPKDRNTLGVVCRSWKAIVNRSPWLIFYHRSDKMWKFIQSNDLFEKDFPELHNAEIRCSKYGWLLMSRDDYTLFFFDPYDSMVIELPAMEYTYRTITFFNPPTCPHCFVFGISDHVKSSISAIGMLKRGENKWTSYRYKNKFPFRLSSCNPVLGGEFLYCLDVNGNIGTFNINGQFSEDSWMVYTNCLSPPSLSDGIKQHYLFKIHAQKTIFVVFVEHDEGKVNVFRLLETEMKWELVQDLGDKMLFASYSAAFEVIAPEKCMTNRIYFPMFHGDKGVFYSLDTQKYHSFESDYTSIDSYGFKEFRFATWYRPLQHQSLWL